MKNERKEELKDEMKNRISMALKDPILQQGFEIICKENAELKEKLEGAEKARDYWKDSSFDWRHKCTSRKPFKVAVKAQKQLAKAKELLKKWVFFLGGTKEFKSPLQEETERFLQEQGNEV